MTRQYRSFSLTKPVVIHLQLTFHRRALRTCSGHHHHPHARPSAVREVLWTVLLAHHLHKGTTLHVLQWLHCSVPLNNRPLSCSSLEDRQLLVIHGSYFSDLIQAHFLHYTLLNSNFLQSCTNHDSAQPKGLCFYPKQQENKTRFNLEIVSIKAANILKNHF